MHGLRGWCLVRSTSLLLGFRAVRPKSGFVTPVPSCCVFLRPRVHYLTSELAQQRASGQETGFSRPCFIKAAFTAFLFLPCRVKPCTYWLCVSPLARGSSQAAGRSGNVAFGLFLLVLVSVPHPPSDSPPSALLRTEVIIYVVERSPNGTSRRVPATTLHAHFEQANIKSSLQQLGVGRSMPKTELSPAQAKQLLQNPPAGLWPGAVRGHSRIPAGAFGGILGKTQGVGPWRTPCKITRVSEVLCCTGMVGSGFSHSRFSC